MTTDSAPSERLAWFSSRLGSISNKTFLAFGILIAVMVIHLGNETYLKGAPQIKPMGQQEYAEMQGRFEQLQTLHQTILDKVSIFSGQMVMPANAGQNTFASISPFRRGPRVFDVFLMEDELDMLEIRLHELYPVVDFILVIESELNFYHDEPKKLVYKENQGRFKQYHDKIIYIVVPPMNAKELEHYKTVHGWWAQEFYTRDKGLEMVIHTHRPREGDWILFSNIDEIPRRSFVKNLREPDMSQGLGRRLTEGRPEFDGDIIRLGCRFHYYSYEYGYDVESTGPMLVKYRDADSPTFTKENPYVHIEYARNLTLDGWKTAGTTIRGFNGLAFPILEGQCYHCSWCFANIAKAWDRYRGYSREPRDKEWMLERYNRGMEMTGREVYWEYQPAERDYPLLVAENQERFSYMLRRHGLPNAGFLDVDPNHPLA